MDEKIVFKEIRNKAKKSLVTTIILTALAYTGFVSFLFVVSTLEYIDRNYYNCNNAFEYFTYGLLNGNLLTPFIVISLVCLLIILISIYSIRSTRCNFSVSENNIYGKKGYKKFDISFGDITEISKKGKGIIIKTKTIKLKLSPLKNCNEIYNYIKPFVPEITLKQNDIKNILD